MSEAVGSAVAVKPLCANYRIVALEKMLIVLMQLTLLAHFVKEVFLPGVDGLTYYCSYVAWTIYLFFVLRSRGASISRANLILVCLTAFGAVMGFALGSSRYDSVEMHRVLFYLVAVVAVLVSKPAISKEGLKNILVSLIAFGVFASLYAMVVQSDELRAVLAGSDPDLNSWGYHSFFSQRNIFAEYMFLSICSAGAMYYYARKKRYLLCLVLFLLQIVITNSRSSTVASIVFLAALLWSLTKRNRVFVICAIALVSISVIAFFDVGGYLYGYFTHYGTTLSNESRVDMWITGVNLLQGNAGMLFGLGGGAANDALFGTYGVGSFHNVYVETLFEGGILRIGVTGFLLIRLMVHLASTGRVFEDGDAKAVWLPLIVAFCVYMLFESGVMLFAANYFSFIATILVMDIPTSACSQKIVCQQESGSKAKGSALRAPRRRCIRHTESI